ncbi:Outer membrane receptor protein [Ignavibacterium album JCM 16511]|uniref:Outer membrane receptor protein n=1 Tax=Ignavibacterium album (strain DSM 19864 / JCM 16511 / NBRC 101810 / Mat9-16) TaxID=945713 RepID=I0AP14_IGNAJ|nr:TonB-dependent receptor [Ignavibacterium album]AFH50721.1 Outer membrane receptor protein [Ignavibacterium album JCM 16511]
MKLFYKLFLSLILFQSWLIIFPQTQTGTIRGKVLDLETGEPIVGANVYIENKDIGAATDINGIFEIKSLHFGNYNLIVSYISYKTVKLENLKVDAGNVTAVNIALEKRSLELSEEVVVIGETFNNYEAALLNQRKKSNQISDGISAEQIKKLTDATTAETLRRVPGITLLDNKYIYVRGVSERYNGALLNNTPLASSEPDKKDFAFDLIPSNLIENMIVIKSFTPDEPGDFVGGLVKINTVEFPSEAILSINYSTGYVEKVSTKSIKSYEGSKTDFLGIDNGFRNLPANFPDPLAYKSLDNNYSDTSRYYYSSLLNDKWGLKNSKAILDQSLGLTYGNKFTFLGNDIGLITSFTYKTGFNIKDLEIKDIENEENQTLFFDYKGQKHNVNVYWGGIANLSYKIGQLNKISLRNILTVNSDDEVTTLRGFKYDYQDERIITALRFISRNLFSSQLSGLHNIPLVKNLAFTWKASYSSSFRNEPDFRRAVYTRSISDSNTTLPFRAYIPRDPDFYGGGRFYSYLREFKRGLGLDISQSFDFLKWKFGIFHTNSSRSFNARLLSVTSPFGNASGLIGLYDLDSVFSQDNFRKRIIVMREYYDPSNDYTSFDNLFAYYVMTEVPYSLFNQEFIFIGGFRIENYVLRLRTKSSLATGSNPINVDNFNHDLLPAFALIYRLNNFSNLRLSYSHNINRPQFREIAPFLYYNFEDQTLIRGNPGLKQAYISNYDIRFETFPDLNEIISFSFFLKEFRNPIEKVFVISTGQNDRTFQNSGFARNYGFEIEYRTSVGFLTDILSNFSISGNYSKIWSEIEETNIGLDRKTRPMQGQSPYVINIMLGYNNPTIELSGTISYNRFGKRIVETANFLGSDIYEYPRDIIDVVFTKVLLSNLELKFTIKDLLAKDYELYENEKLVRNFSTNTKISLGVSYRL